ncbi:putative CdaR family transcriptional regulator [Gordonia aichiensis NBRC 108223]|uniref:Putative CdaR family transcriptional regulator n=2 Tax=Gordonia aichiensis TaxID=36820 RepID=L7KNL7_9ACTN|nr:putative CdaR family transcriptional regulator [Gordonia aichiensis NBRC 108223]
MEVHTVRMSDTWPSASPETKALIRRGAELILDPPEQWIQAIHDASLGGLRMKAIADDPVLADATRRTNLANTMRWARSNVLRPGERVPAELTPDILTAARDLVRRGLDESALDAFRTAQSVAWRLWMKVCFSLTDDPDQLRELLDVSLVSISTFIDDTVDAMSERMRSERHELTRGTHAQRREAVALLLEGAPIPIDRAEIQLGYRLRGPHTALVLWTHHPDQAATLESAADALATSAGCASRLTVVASAASLWVWLPTDESSIERLSPSSGIDVAVGRTGEGVDGFRASHFQALATQRIVAQLGSPHGVVRFDDVRLVSLLMASPDDTAAFVDETLGELARAEPTLLDTVRTWISLQCNTSRASEALYTHRNTVIRRLARAEELLPRPLDESLLDVGVALEVLRWRG